MIESSLGALPPTDGISRHGAFKIHGLSTTCFPLAVTRAKNSQPRQHP